jgi:hypothetical protein
LARSAVVSHTLAVVAAIAGAAGTTRYVPTVAVTAAAITAAIRVDVEGMTLLAGYGEHFHTIVKQNETKLRACDL